MTRAVAMLLTIGCAGILVWMMAASYLFLALGGIDIDQPWVAWWLYATDQPDTWTVCLLLLSAALPALAAFAALMAMRRTLNGWLRRPLYGNSAWATDTERRSGGIRSSRSLF